MKDLRAGWIWGPLSATVRVTGLVTAEWLLLVAQHVSPGARQEYSHLIVAFFFFFNPLMLVTCHGYLQGLLYVPSWRMLHPCVIFTLIQAGLFCRDVLSRISNTVWNKRISVFGSLSGRDSLNPLLAGNGRACVLEERRGTPPMVCSSLQRIVMDEHRFHPDL